MPANISKKNAVEPRGEGVWPRVFSLLFGVLIGLSLLKFGNPCVFAKLTPWPENGYEWVLNSWPIEIGYWLLGAVAVIGLFTLRLHTRVPPWLLVMPLAWLGWQFISATQTLDAELTRLTLYHFTACVVCFYLGAFCLGRERSRLFFWLPVLCATVLVIAWGFQQQFGGLEETRRYFFAYVYPHLNSVPPEYMKKISSDRIFSTLFYPNALAGVIVLLLPPTLVIVWQSSERLTVAARSFLIALFGAAALACLFWSGSKGGWLLTLFSGLIAMLHLPFAKRLKVILVAVLLVAGITGFFWKYSGFFQRGAKSVHARFDYWEAALKITAARPVLGSGPGAFGVSYKTIKRPESEMARLTHNDYLEQASDSGVLGFATYLAWMAGIIWLGYSKPQTVQDAFGFSIWLGFFGWALQGIMEFGLYIPALAWTAFALAGWISNRPPTTKQSNGLGAVTI